MGNVNPGTVGGNTEDHNLCPTGETACAAAPTYAAPAVRGRREPDDVCRATELANCQGPRQRCRVGRDRHRYRLSVAVTVRSRHSGRSAPSWRRPWRRRPLAGSVSPSPASRRGDRLSSILTRASGSRQSRCAAGHAGCNWVGMKLAASNPSDFAMDATSLECESETRSSLRASMALSAPRSRFAY